MTVSSPTVGIDVAKSWLDCHRLPCGTAWRVPVRPDALQALAAKLAEDGALAVFEASGGYERPLAEALDAAGAAHAMVNPRRVRDFARASGRLAKTDRIDAAVIAAYAQALQPAPRTAPSPARQRLKALLARRRQLVEMRKAETLRLKQVVQADLAEDMKAHIASLSAMIADLEARIDAAAEQEPELTEARARLASMTGIGPVASATLVAEMPELGCIGAKRAAMLAGLAPLARDSGLKQGVRTCWGGRKIVRDLLYLAAQSAVRFQPRFKAFYEQLLARGKAKKSALIAVARKILVTLNAMQRDQKNFAP